MDFSQNIENVNSTWIITPKYLKLLHQIEHFHENFLGCSSAVELMEWNVSYTLLSCTYFKESVEGSMQFFTDNTPV